MSRTGMELCWTLLEEEDLEVIRDAGVKPEFIRGESRPVYEYIINHWRDYGKMPDRETLLQDVDIRPEMEDLDPVEPCRYYADKVVQRAALKAQRSLVREIGQALGDRDPEGVYEAAKDLITESVFDFHLGQGQIQDFTETGQDQWERYLVRKAADGGILGIRSPWDTLDQETGGWLPGALTTIVARLGIGKTWAALMVALAAEEQGKTVGFVSLEMEAEAVEIRRQALKYGIPYRDLRRAELDSETEERLMAELLKEKQDGASFFIASSGRVTTIAETEIFAQETNCDLLIVDGIYLMNEGEGRMPMHERVMLAIRGLKRLGQKQRLPTLCTAQFNRTVKKGSMQAGSEAIGHTDAIGQDSDNVLALFRDKELREANMMMFSTLKVREGVPVEMIVNWDFQSMDFTVAEDTGSVGDLDDDDEDGGLLF